MIPHFKVNSRIFLPKKLKFPQKETNKNPLNGKGFLILMTTIIGRIYIIFYLLNAHVFWYINMFIGDCLFSAGE